MKARLSDRRINIQQGIEGFKLFRFEIRDQGLLCAAASNSARRQPHAFDHVHRRQENPALPERGDNCLCDHRPLICC